MSEHESSRERVLAAVLARIEAAPRVQPYAPTVDLIAWARPALIAALLVLAISSALLTRPAPAPATVADAVGAARPLIELASGGGERASAWDLER